jgi:hypothetical protein
MRMDKPLTESTFETVFLMTTLAFAVITIGLVLASFLFV